MTITSYRPYDGTPFGSVRETDPAQVDAQVGAATGTAGLVAALSPADRSAWLERIAAVLEQDATELVALADAGTGLGVARLTQELSRTMSQLRFYGAVAREGSYLGVTIDSATATQPRLVRVGRPLGPVAVFEASNFPFAFGALGTDTASALAAGCPVVVKAHPAHALLSERLGALAAGALADAGAPPGVLSVVAGLDAGRRLVQTPGIAAVGFTGSQAGGLALWRLAHERAEVIPFYAEMGTVNTAVMTPAAAGRTSAIAAGFVGSFTLGSGQFCTKPGLLLAPAGAGVADAVAEALHAADPRGPMLTRAIAETVATDVEALSAAGAEVLARRPGPATGWGAEAVVLRAPVAALRSGSRLLQECFGAVALVAEYESAAELDAAIAELPGALAAVVMTDGTGEDPDAGRLVGRLAASAGRVAIDDWPTGVAWTWAQHHGGPWPSTSAPAATSVGAGALDRWVRPVAYQSVREEWLPPAAHDDNPWRITRRVDGLLQPAAGANDPAAPSSSKV